MNDSTHRTWLNRLLVTLIALAGAAAWAADYDPKLEPASDEAAKAMTAFTVPQGMKLELFAAEPMVANPVAFYIDHKGRHFVCETFRQSTRGIPDNRDHMYWLNDDLAAMTVEDRRRMYEKHLSPEVLKTWSTDHDRIRLVEDTDGDGKADRAKVFADGFNDVLDGTGSGVLVRGNTAWYTCIPHLWQLLDADGDGKADDRKSLHGAGYGVRVAFRGHDLHGMTLGPDGKLYFSIGDRGLNVTSREGVNYALPDQGAVLRCDLDGGNLEVFATGLRNPQELAFDQYGNLFTGDNNCDAGDQARIVYLVEGGDSGWRMSYQYMPDRGPWMPERWWQPRFDGQAAFLNAPIANLTNGPSGFAAYPGVGLPKRYDGHLFLCDFKGSPNTSGIWSFAMKPKGAGFELDDVHQFVWNTLVTDCDFGPDGSLYFTDWVNGWTGMNKGRIYKLTDPSSANEEAARQAKKLLAEGMAGRSIDELAALLAHADQRVRQEAQFALAAKGQEAIPRLTNVVQRSDNQMARIHAAWALGQIGRTHAEAYRPVIQLMRDKDPEIRAQAAKVCGDGGERQATSYFTYMLEFEPSPRAQYFAAMGLGKLRAVESVDALIDFIERNGDKDAYLRHAGVMALYWIGDAEGIKRAAKHSSPAVRMAALLALRRFENPAVAHFLNDPDPALVVEAARAINDVPIHEAMPRLATLIVNEQLTDPALLRRVINANFRVGHPINAEELARFAARADAPEPWRIEALQCLSQWAVPSPRDRVMGLWRPLEIRDIAPARAALSPVVDDIAKGSPAVTIALIRAAAQIGARDAGDRLYALASDTQQPADVRVAALEAMGELTINHLRKAVEESLKDDQPAVRRAAQKLMSKVNADTVGVMARVLNDGSLIERQGAFANLADLKSPAADGVLIDWLDRLLDGKTDEAIQLDLLTAAASRREANPAIDEKLKAYEASLDAADPLAAYRPALQGGNAERGRVVFHENVAAQCLRCHRVDANAGAEVGPVLEGIGGRQTRQYLLEALVNPNAKIADGFGTVVVVLKNGDTKAGVLKKETDTTLLLDTPTADPRITKTETVNKADIASRTAPVSAMPPQGLVVSKQELRDLIEYLSGLK